MAIRRPVLISTACTAVACAKMGFDVVPVSTEALNAGFDWSKADVLYVSAGLEYGKLTPAARDAFRASGVGASGSARTARRSTHRPVCSR
jgi:hypothetical protein